MRGAIRRLWGHAGRPAGAAARRPSSVRALLFAAVALGVLPTALLAQQDDGSGTAAGETTVSPVRVQAQAQAEPQAGTPQSDAELRKTPALLQADEASYDEQTNVVTARGNVEISQGERILLADEVRYDLESDVITAEGNVSLLQPGGDVAFADRVQLTGDLRQGALRAFRALLTDNSRLAAASAVRSDDNRTEMRKGVFSPCQLCRDDPSKAPLWQLRAHRVVHDKEDKTISYRDAYLEFFGIPVLYTPYLEHPDPTKERQSGFLPPTIGSSDELGLTFQLPYYWAISRSSDLTLRPIFTTEQSVVGLGTYRRRFGNGQLELTLSGTQQQSIDDSNNPGIDEGDFRGHIDALGQFNIDENWRWGFDVERSSDDTYLRVYDLDDTGERFLDSKVYAERFEGRNYFSAQTLAWQGLRRGDETDELPLALPELRYNFISEPGVAGGVAYAETSALNLQRLDGRDTRRLSTTVGWDLPHVDRLGGRTTLKTALHLDGYSYDGHSTQTNAVDPDPTAFDLDDGTTGRAFPQIALQYAYPLVRHSAIGQEVLEPTVQVVAGPNGGNPDEIPNEDSRSFEFADDNFFDLNRFPGRDRVSSGQRIDYGVSYDFTTRDGSGSASAFLGQSYRINTDDALPESVGADDDFSDFVGSVQVSPVPYVDAAYRFRIDEDTLDLNRTEVAAYLGPPALNLNVNYSRLNNDETLSAFGSREEIDVALRSRFARYWSAYVGHRRDLVANEALTTDFGLTYHDECFLIDFTAQRRFYTDRDLEPETRFLVRFSLKHLGQFTTGTAVAGSNE